MSRDIHRDGDEEGRLVEYRRLKRDIDVSSLLQSASVLERISCCADVRRKLYNKLACGTDRTGSATYSVLQQKRTSAPEQDSGHGFQNVSAHALHSTDEDISYEKRA